MKTIRWTSVFRVAWVLAPGAWLADASCQVFPERSIRWIVPLAAGRTPDAIARVVAQKTAELLGQPVVVDNRPAAGGTIGTSMVASSTPDGYTWAMVGNCLPVDPLFHREGLPLEPELQLVVVAATTPLAVASGSRAPSETDHACVEFARDHPDPTFSAWVGIGVHADTPIEIVARINRAVNTALLSADTRAELTAIGAAAGGGSVAYAERFVAEEAARRRKLMRGPAAEMQ